MKAGTRQPVCLPCGSRTTLELALFSLWFLDLALPTHESAATLQATLEARLSQRSEKTNERDVEIEKGRYQRRIKWSWHTARVRPKWLNLIPWRRRRGRPLVESTLVYDTPIDFRQLTSRFSLFLFSSLSLPFRKPVGRIDRKITDIFGQIAAGDFLCFSTCEVSHAMLGNCKILRLRKMCINHSR